MQCTPQQTCGLFNFRIPCRHGISHSEMRAHIFLQRPAAVPLESACLAVVTHRQTLVFCASFPGGDFFGACPKPLHAMHGGMSGFAGLEIFEAFQSGPRDGGAGLGIHLGSGTQDRGQPTGRGTPQILRRDLSARSAGHSPGTCRALPQPRPACTGPPGRVQARRPSEGLGRQLGAGQIARPHHLQPSGNLGQLIVVEIAYRAHPACVGSYR